MRCLNCGYTGIPLNTVTCTNCGVHLPSLMRDCLEPGTMLCHNTYHIDYPLGRGGFGITYRGFDTRLQRPVAIKEFYPQEHATREGLTGRLVVPNTKYPAYQRGLKRFLREGALLAQLEHPGVVRVYNSFEERETAYLVMELISGRTLRDELEEQPEHKLSVARTQEIMSQLVSALSVVHQEEIYHLDLAPDNVMLTQNGRVVLIDFGASRQGLGGGTTQAFKESYAPPEVIDCQQAGAFSDIFELGMVLHEMLTGKLPPSSISRIYYKINHQGTESWDASRVQEPWRSLIAEAIRLHPEERPNDVRGWWTGVPLRAQDFPTTPEPQAPDLPINHTTPYTRTAGCAVRLLAYLIDLMLLALGSAIVIVVMHIEYQSASEYLWWFFSMHVVLGCIYCSVMDSSPKRGTVGKLAIGIAVTDLSGRRVTLQRAFTRYVFSYVTVGVGFLMVGFTDRRQALHDRIAKCIVVWRS